MKKPYNKLYTEAGERLENDPSIIPWDVYPRPHLRRKEWLNLNGFWELETESGFKGKVRVPFPLESLLSGFEGELRQEIQDQDGAGFPGKRRMAANPDNPGRNQQVKQNNDNGQQKIHRFSCRDCAAKIWIFDTFAEEKLRG